MARAARGCSIAVLAALSVCGVGCGPDPRGWLDSSRYAYTKGELERIYSAKPDAVWDACLEGLAKLNTKVVGEKKAESGGTIDAVRDDGVAVRITLEALGSRSIAVRVKVGETGDRPLSMTIHEAIAASL